MKKSLLKQHYLLTLIINQTRLLLIFKSKTYIINYDYRRLDHVDGHLGPKNSVRKIENYKKRRISGFGH
jgi:hypothetical protein